MVQHTWHQPPIACLGVNRCPKQVNSPTQKGTVWCARHQPASCADPCNSPSKCAENRTTGPNQQATMTRLQRQFQHICKGGNLPKGRMEPSIGLTPVAHPHHLTHSLQAAPGACTALPLLCSNPVFKAQTALHACKAHEPGSHSRI
jgi:hypothetical protein